jgi:hypothetical protein
MTTIFPVRYWLAGAAALAVALLLLSGWPAAGYEYRTARALFHDCSATKGSDRQQNCAESLRVLYSNWQLEQGDSVCSRLVVSALPDAYVQYWRKRGLGFLSGEFRSAVASVNDFLDSERQPCPQNSSKLPE